MEAWNDVGHWVMRALSYLGVMVSAFGAMVLITASAPGFVRRESDAARAGMRRCFLWGLVFVLNCVLVAALLASFAGIAGSVVALAVMVALLVVTLAGLAAVASEVGRRVLGLAERWEGPMLTRLLVGTLVLFVTAVVPVFGWLVFAGALLVGIGAFLDTAVDDTRGTRAVAPAGDAAIARSASG